MFELRLTLPEVKLPAQASIAQTGKAQIPRGLGYFRTERFAVQVQVSPGEKIFAPVFRPTKVGTHQIRHQLWAEAHDVSFQQIVNTSG